VLALTAGVALAVIIRAPLPQYDGTITLTGPTDEVAVRRDGQGVPHIYASSDHDLFFAQGYVQAQDRFFQMDLRRHLTAGRLSALVGEAVTSCRGERRVRREPGAHVRRRRPRIRCGR